MTKRQRGSILKPSGKRRTWAIKYRDSGRSQVMRAGFRTKGDAQAELNRLLEALNTGTYVKRSPATFGQFAEEWLASRRRIRGSTESAYGSVIRAQLIPRLGRVRVSDLCLKDVRRVVDEMIEDEMASKSIHNAVTLLRTMLVGGQKGAGASARRLGLIHADPTEGLELPRLESRKIVPPAPEEVWALIDAAKSVGGIVAPLALVAAYTGMRRNEILALTWSAIDWFNHQIRVNVAISKQKATDGAHKWEWVVGEPKSRPSVRRINVPESVLKTLAELKSMAASDFVFPDAQGRFIDPDMFDAEIWAPVPEAAGRKTRFHDLRHFFASHLIGVGETAAYVRDQLGHSSIQVTFDTYGHLFPQKQQESAKRFETSMQEARKGAGEAPGNSSGINSVETRPKGSSGNRKY